MTPCPLCGNVGTIVNECRCDPNNLPTRPIPPLQRILGWCDRGGEEPEGHCLYEIENICRHELGLALLSPKIESCGHPTAMFDRRLESGEVFCRVCELQERLRDAEGNEKSLVAERDRWKEQRDRFLAFCRAVCPEHPKGASCWDGEIGETFRKLLDKDRQRLSDLLDEAASYCPVAVQDRIRIAIAERPVHPTTINA